MVRAPAHLVRPALQAVAAFVCTIALCPARPPVASSQPSGAAGDSHQLNDCHLHLTNYVQQGTTMRSLVATMGARVGRAAVFGIPLQQKWSYANSGDYAPTYYLSSDAPLDYYAFTDAQIALEYRSLPVRERARIDPMITGFNPSDMYAVDHIRRVLLAFPGVFSGIGEFSIHKEFVSAKIADGAPSLTDPALDRILAFAAEVGLVVLLHNDVDAPFAKPGSEPVYLQQMRALLARHPRTTIVWAHTGLGRVVRPVGRHAALLESMLADRTFAHVYLDISWDEVAKYLLASPESLQIAADLINRFPDRFLFGSDEVAPRDAQTLLRTFERYQPLWAALSPEASRKVRKHNYERLFDAARRRVRDWENRHSQLN